jgi:hypothetical protein
MKRSTILFASVVALAVIAMSAGGASAATYSTTKSNSRGKGIVTGPGGPKKQDKSTTVNPNGQPTDRMGGGGGARGGGARMGGGGGGRTK